MIPVFEHGRHGDKGYSYEDFESGFIEICEEHRRDERAFAFAFILCDFSHPNVLKVLKDRDYWKALDKISGNYLTVFSFHTNKPSRKRPRSRYSRGGESDGGMMHWMTTVDCAYTSTTSDGQGVIDRYFALDGEVSLPAMLFFQVSDGQVSGASLVQLNELKIEETYLEIRDVLITAAKSVSSVAPENIHNDHEVFALIESALENRKVALTVKKSIKKIMSVADLVSILMGMKP